MQSRLVGRLRAGAAFALASLALLPLPVLAFWLAERRMSAGNEYLANVLFFLPQMAFPFAISVEGASRSMPISRSLVLAAWAALAVAFGFAAARLRTRWLVLVAPAAVLACVIAFQFALGAFGYHVELDGP